MTKVSELNMAAAAIRNKAFHKAVAAVDVMARLSACGAFGEKCTPRGQMEK